VVVVVMCSEHCPQVISDLLKPDKVNLMIREDRRRGVFVDGLSEWVVRSPAEVYGLMMRGAQQVCSHHSSDNRS